MRMKLFGAVIVVGGLITAVALPIACRRAPGQDDSPLPRGARVEPEVEPELSQSRILVPIRFTLSSLQRLVGALVPRKLDRSLLGFDGVVELGELRLAATDKEELVVTGTGNLSGTVPTPIGQLKINAMRFNIDGSRGHFVLSSDFGLRLEADVEATIESLDADSWFTDKSWKNSANKKDIVDDRIQRALQKVAFPLARPAQAALQMVDGKVIKVPLGPARPIVSRVESSFVSRPRITPHSGDLTLTIGLDIRAEGSALPVVAQRTDSEPKAPNIVDEGGNPVSDFNVPLVIDIAELDRLWKPVSVHVPYGTCRVERAQFSEQNGQLFMKAVIAFEPQQGWASILLRRSEATVLLSCRPVCDEKTKRLALKEIAFTAKSDSLVVEWLGGAVRPILLDAIQQAVPSLIDSAVLRAQGWVNDSAQGYVRAMIEEWKRDKSGYQEIVRDLRPTVESCSLRVSHVRLADGFLTVGVHGTAVLGINFDPDLPP